MFLLWVGWFPKNFVREKKKHQKTVKIKKKKKVDGSTKLFCERGFEGEKDEKAC